MQPLLGLAAGRGGVDDQLHARGVGRGELVVLEQQAADPGVAEVPAADRNLLWVVFTDPAVRTLLGDWAGDSRRFLTQFRAEVGPRLADREVVDLVTRLQAASPAFREGWASHDVDRFTSSERRFEHPAVGTLVLEHHQLTPADAPGLQLVVYTAADGTGTAAKLAQLAD